MQATTTPLSFILSPRERYVAPLFQRPYVWEREANWEPFWETVREVADHYVEQKAVRPRFLGAIVVESMNVQIGQVPTRQIIDGQQRLTTLQIMLAAARDVYKKWCAEMGWLAQLEMPLQQLTANYPPLVHADEEFKVWPTNSDRPYFRAVMTAGSPTELAIKFGAPRQWQEGTAKNPVDYVLGQSSDPQVQRYLDYASGWNEEESGVEWSKLDSTQQAEIRRNFKKYTDGGHRMVKAYWYFWSSLAIWLETDEQAVFAARMQAFLNAIQQGIVLVSINLDAGEDAQLIFETMNARGLPLSPADLVKNFLFREAQRVDDDLQTLYDNHWKSFDEDNWWRENIRQGRLLRPRLDAYLWNYLTLSTRSEVLAADLFATYRDWALSSKNSLTPSQQIARFAEYAAIYRSFESETQPERVKVFFKRLAVLDVSTIYPLLLELFKRHRYANHDLELILVDLESFLVRRLLVGLTTKNYNRYFFDLLQTLERSGDFSPAAVRTALLSGTVDSNIWPNDEMLKKAMLTRSLYGYIKADRLTHILGAINKQMHTAKSENFNLTDKLTIEHLMPQSWQTNWPLLDDQNTEANREARENLVHTIGNLTLVKGELNSSLSNSAWATKHETIKEHSALIFNRTLPDVWDENAIKTRGAELCDYAKMIWPYPNLNTPHVNTP